MSSSGSSCVICHCQRYSLWKGASEGRLLFEARAKSLQEATRAKGLLSRESGKLGRWNIAGGGGRGGGDAARTHRQIKLQTHRNTNKEAWQGQFECRVIKYPRVNREREREKERETLIISVTEFY